MLSLLPFQYSIKLPNIVIIVFCSPLNFFLSVPVKVDDGSVANVEAEEA